MRAFIAIFKKEIRELLTKDLLISLVFLIALFGFMGRVGRDIERELKVGIYSPTAFTFPLLKEGFELISAPSVEDALTIAKLKDMHLLLALPCDWEKNLSQGIEIDLYWLVGDFSLGAQISEAKVKALLSHLNKEVSRSIITDIAPDKDAEKVLSPVDTRDILVIRERVVEGDPAMMRGIVTQQGMLIPLVLMLVLMYAGTLVITSMGMEKEAKTLETLLSLPVSRISIITGKMAGSASIAFLMTIVYIVGFRYYMGAFVGTGDVGNLSQFGLEITPQGFILLGISIFLSILSALMLAIILGTFAQDTKGAQTLITPIVFLVIIPFFVNMMMGIENLSLLSRTFIYLIPFTHSTIASQYLLFAEYPPVIYGIIYNLFFVLILMFIATRIFESDRILLGWRMRWRGR